MRNAFFTLVVATLLGSCAIKKSEQVFVRQDDVERLIRTLSSDEMQGREVFSPGIEKAAQFIESEFKSIGLQPLPGLKSYRQEIIVRTARPLATDVTVAGEVISAQHALVISDESSVNWSEKDNIPVHYVKAGESFASRYRAITALNKPAVVFVDESFFDAFKRLRDHHMRDRVFDPSDQRPSTVYILTDNDSPATFSVSFRNQIESSSMSNIVGVLPGKSREKEMVIFSGHYDHIGVIDPVAGDSIANGADDDASGVTAVISLAKHFKQQDDQERTLVFVAFTAEEVGLVGSKYFSEKLTPEDVAAMFNIEMIGKQSMFGKNTAFITGFERSDFGKILQKNLEATDFKFHPDPYPQQQLFYRSDNATLASLGVPAHTISTVQIDKDEYYHTVDDELSTLDISNIQATIKAIALSARTIVNGSDTPTRIPPVKN
ncbi:M28 family metallopeptidase [Pedobacter sp. SYSU D00535]|uniref:M28 family metallopeptidase n=1 Tax=Pedobacter sp. SYSU D00535 TaxID=2810308 RepID=UPI001A95CD51|nr:M20/M25/M40 family metallo-hydrolase [Pedobacter sp. SYSU D00535]